MEPHEILSPRSTGEVAPSPPGAEPAETVPAPGELVLQNGRHTGTRRALSRPLTLIGRAQGCDIRLNVESVKPLHCAFIQAPDGVVLRDLDGGTLVNGAAAGTRTLSDNDEIVIGPFVFRLRLPAAPTGTQGELESVRIQAAATAAQQAALTEEEIRVQQRRAALERQEEQLAARLEERRQHLLDLQEQIRKARSDLDNERSAAEQRSAELLGDLTRAHGEVALTQKKLQAERGRLSELRRRLKRRWRQHWSAHETALRQRGQAQENRHHQLEKEAHRLQEERAAFNAERLRFNGEVELGRRQIQDGWSQLRQAQKHWEERRQREYAEARRQAEVLEERAAVLAEGEKALADQRRQNETGRATLEREREGLENRIRHLRRKLLEQEQEAVRLAAILESRAASLAVAAQPQTAPVTEKVPAEVGEMPANGNDAPATPRDASAAVEPVQPPQNEQVAVADRPEPRPAADPVRLALLERLAGDLADQRIHLAEQFARFVQLEEDWRQGREALTAELEEMALRLQEREQRVAEEERTLHAATAELRVRQEDTSQLRCHLEGWQARLRAREAAWHAERGELIARVEAHEKFTGRQRALLDTLQRRWSVRREREVALLRKELGVCQELRRQYATLWDECERRRAGLGLEQRTLAERTLTLEQLQLESLGSAPNGAAAERRLERLRRQAQALYAEAEQQLAQERQALQTESARLEERVREVQQQTEQMLRGVADLSARQTEWESEQLLAQAVQAQRERETHSLRGQCEVYSRQLVELRDEVERLARLLLEEAEPRTPSVQAA